MAEHRCPECGRLHEWMRSPEGRCFACSNADNPFLGVTFSIDMGPQDSADPQRVREGTQSFNIGLPGVDTVVGQRRDGKPRLSYRPITNNEIGTSRNRREYAKRHGLIPVDPTPKRAIV